MFRSKREAARVRRLEEQRAQYDAAVAVTEDQKRRAVEFSEAALAATERLAAKWERVPDRGDCARELRDLVDRLRGLRDGRVL